MTNHPTLGRYVIPDMPSADELLPYLRQIDANRWYSNFGPLVTEFEKRLTDFLTARDTKGSPALHVVTLMTCYHALKIGLQIMHLPPGSLVLVPDMTFPACALAAQHVGLTPVLADIDLPSWQLTPELARKMCAALPIRAVMPVAVYGVPVDADAWDRFTQETKIPVIIDAAAAFEVQKIPQHCMVAHSFHATKPFSVGEGGVLISRHKNLIDEARCISNFGTINRIAVQDGSNAKMSEYHAATGLAQLDRWEGIKLRRRRIFELYQQALKDFGHTLLFQQGIGSIVVSALMLRSLSTRAADIISAFVERGIGAHRMYLPPLHTHPHFQGLSVVNADGRHLDGAATQHQKDQLMVNGAVMNEQLFGLPCHAFLQQSDVEEIVGLLANYLDQPSAQGA